MEFAARVGAQDWRVRAWFVGRINDVPQRQRERCTKKCTRVRVGTANCATDVLAKPRNKHAVWEVRTCPYFCVPRVKRKTKRNIIETRRGMLRTSRTLGALGEPWGGLLVRSRTRASSARRAASAGLFASATFAAASTKADLRRKCGISA